MRVKYIMIPKKIFFFWEGGPLPERYKSNISYIAAVNPDHEIQIIDSKAAIDILKKVTPKLYSIYDNIYIPSVRSDIIRLAILYKYGGWYIDCDNTPRVALDSWSDGVKGAVVFHKMAPNNKIDAIPNLIAGVAGHPLFERAMQNIEQAICNRVSHYSVYKTSGPTILMYAISKYWNQDDVSCLKYPSQYVDTIFGGSKGSWVFQECCGIWSNEEFPLRFNGNAKLDRFESIDAFEYFKKQFDLFPVTRDENYKKLLLRAGSNYIQKHRIGEEIFDLSKQYVPCSEKSYYKKIYQAAAYTNDTATMKKISKFSKIDFIAKVKHFTIAKAHSFREAFKPNL